MRRTCLKTAKCPVARSLDAVGDWWTLLIVRDALKGARRFGDFQQGLGLAKNILTNRLRQMVEAGLLERRPAADGGGHHEYHLTERGYGLEVVLVALRQWGEQYLYATGEPMNIMVDREQGKQIPRLALTAQDGRAITMADVAFKEGRAGRRRAP